MNDQTASAVAKVHPATREMLPEDPMELHGHELPGDPDLMLRVIVEEFARMGWNADSIMLLACDPNYQAFSGLRALYGVQRLRSRIEHILSRCGVMRVRTMETSPASERLVQLDLPA
jgi:hypothetical protein